MIGVSNLPPSRHLPNVGSRHKHSPGCCNWSHLPEGMWWISVYFHPMWMMENDGRNAFHVNWLFFMDNYCTLLILLKQTQFFWVAASIYFHPFSLISIEFNSAIATNYRDGDTLFATRFDTMALVYYDLYYKLYISTSLLPRITVNSIFRSFHICTICC